MAEATVDLDGLQANYKAAVEEWIKAIRNEEALASIIDHSEAKLDQWQKAHFAEEDARNKAKAAKKEYEDGLREEIFGF